MKKKIICLALCIFLLAPVTFATGVSQKPELITNNIVEQLDIDPNIVDMINQINESLVSGYLTDLVDIGPRFTGSNNCKKAANYIFDEFEEMGLDVYIDNWKYLRYRCQNVVATLNGTDPSSDAIFIICAHYDTITFKIPFIIPPREHSIGANDDGSGIAAMLAIADILSQYSFNHTVKFIAFAGEEVGCYGSNDYAMKAYDRNENIVGVLNLDTIGCANSEKEGKHLKISYPKRSEWMYEFSQIISEKYRSHVDINIQHSLNMPCDHASFTDYGFDGVMFAQYGPMEYIHSPEDTIDKINFSYLSKVTKFILVLTVELANKPIDIQIRIVSPYEGYTYFFDKPVLKLPNFNLDRVNYDGATIIFGRCYVRVNVTSNEEIKKINYCIDDYWIPSKESETEWRIQGFTAPLIGRHTLGVYVYTESGKFAYDEMDIFIVTFSFSFIYRMPLRQH